MQLQLTYRPPTGYANSFLLSSFLLSRDVATANSAAEHIDSRTALQSMPLHEPTSAADCAAGRADATEYVPREAMASDSNDAILLRLLDKYAYLDDGKWIRIGKEFNAKACRSISEHW